MSDINFILLIFSSLSLGAGVFFGLWAFLGLGYREDDEHVDYMDVRYRQLKEKSPVFRHCFVLVLELADFSRYSPRMEIIRRDLPMGERGNPWEPEEFLGLVRTQAILAALGFGIFTWVLIHPIASLMIAPFVYLFYEPLRIRLLSDAAEKRRRFIRQRLPLIIDLLSLSLGAGSTFSGSLATAVRENRNHPIGEEFGEVLRQIGLGVPERKSLEALAKRVSDEPVDEMVFAVNKAMELGVPLANTLAEIADQMRLKVQQWGEKAAAEAQVKILFPSVVIMVACMIVIVAPFVLPAIFGEAM